MSFARHAPAKLNLLLRIVGRRPDGYHELETVFHGIDLADTVYLASRNAPGLKLTVTADLPFRQLDDVPTDARNLAWRAAEAWFAAANQQPSCSIHLHKRIPAGAGLGGGSSDAAAVLLLLNQSQPKPLDAQHLAEIAATLGADVPFFLVGGTQAGTGVGDTLTPLEPFSAHFLLILPSFTCSTPAVYKNLAAQLTEKTGLASIDRLKASWHKELAMPWGFPNDLEPSAMLLYPELRNLADQITACGFSQVRMSGSGSTLYLAFSDKSTCLAAQDRLSREPSLTDQGVVLWPTRSGVSPGIWAETFPEVFPR